MKTWGPTWDIDEQAEFRDRVTTALADGRLHYAVVAQRFTNAMERTAAYLNASVGSLSFYLVELIRFSNGSIDAFEARTVLKPQQQRGGGRSGSAHDKATFLNSEPDDKRRENLRDLLEFCTALGLVVFWGTTGISVRLPATANSPSISLAWVHPSGVVGWMGLSDLVLGYPIETAQGTASLEGPIQSYIAALAALPGGTKVKASNLNAYSFAGPAESANLAAIREIIANLAEAAASA